MSVIRERKEYCMKFYGFRISNTNNGLLRYRKVNFLVTSELYICFFQIILTCLLVITQPALSQAKENVTIQRELKVAINPESHHLDVQDTITIHKRHRGDLGFFLHSCFNPSSPTANVRIIRVNVSQ